MIRTHRPTGHHWTCASAFQQSKQYRNLDAQDWDAPLAKTLVTDPDDELPDSSRVAKRRRIETLANGFLEGKPLFISSALANGPDLTTTVEKILLEKNLTWDELLDDHDDELWADGEDGWTTLKKRSKTRLRLRSSRSQPNSLRKSTRQHLNEPVPAVAISQPPTHNSTINPQPRISTAPSNDALIRAAELRARKASLVAKSAQPAESLLPQKGQVTQSAPPTARANSSFKDCSSSRPFNPKTPAETTMADELRLSRTDSPSHRPRAFTLPMESFESGTTVEDLPTHDDAAEPMATGSTAMELCAAEQNRASTNRTANGDILAGRTRQSTLGGNVHIAWTPINDRQKQAFAPGEHTHTRGMSSTALAQSSFIPFGTSLIDPVKTPRTCSTAKATSQHTTTSTRSRKSTNTPSSPKETSQQSNQSRLTHSFKASKAKHAAAENSQSGTTPFVYRKKTKATKPKSASPSRLEDDLQRPPKPSINGDITPKPSYLSALHEAATPSLDLSFVHDPPSGSAFHTALVDQHINKKLPKDPDSAHRSSSVKKALRAEMRLSGAEISRAPDEPSSSQADEHLAGSGEANQYQSCDDTNRDTLNKRRSTGEWLGTQVLLNRAQHDLFMSSGKVDLSHTAASPIITRNEPVDSSIPHQPHDVANTRQPPCQPPQEFLPCTQALMDTWSPWSTTRKSKSNKRASFAPSPLMAKTPANFPTKPSLKPTTQQKPDLIDRVQETTAKQRRSSLRFSTSTAESPVPPQRIAATPLHGPATIMTPHSAMNKSNHSPSISKHAASQSFYGPTQADASSPNINLDFTNLSFTATAVQPPFVAGFEDTTIETDWSSHAANMMADFHNAQQHHDIVEPLAETVLADVASTFLDTGEFDRAVGGF